jgi:hypothetical protein
VKKLDYSNYNFKVGDIIYYDRLWTHDRVSGHRYNVCIIEQITNNGRSLYGYWKRFNDKFPTMEEIIKKPTRRENWGWMSRGRINLYKPLNVNRRVE